MEIQNAVMYSYMHDIFGADVVDLFDMKYNPLEKTDPDITLSAEEREIGGLGIFMVKKSMDSMRYDYIDGKNVLTVLKHL